VDPLSAKPARHAGDVTEVHLFEGPYVTTRGERLTVPQGSKRLLAFLALRRGRVTRAYAAGALWPLGGDNRAAGNLRSALWRLRRVGIDVVVADKWSLGLADEVVVDVERLGEWARRLINGARHADDLSLTHIPPDALDLLPGWYDDWAIIERERMRQRMLHAMEALSRHLTVLCHHAEAVEVAISAVAAEPLRETAQRTLLEAHLSQGNWAEADRSFDAFRSLIRRELGVNPSDELSRMIAAARPERVAVSR